MPGPYQLDLFDDRPVFDPPPASKAPAEPLVPEGLSDEALISAIPGATLAAAAALAAEAGKRRLSTATPALISLCNQFTGLGATAVVREQAAALDALGAIGGHDAARAVSRVIAKRIVQGPTLTIAVTVAWRLGVVLPNEVSLTLLRHADASVRAAACGCVRAGHEVVATLISMIDDPDDEVAIASACARGRMGRSEALAPLKGHLAERPSPRVVEALAVVADDEAIVLLARAGRARRHLADLIVSALEDIDSPRAQDAAAALKRLAQTQASEASPS